MNMSIVMFCRGLFTIIFILEWVLAVACGMGNYLRLEMYYTEFAKQFIYAMYLRYNAVYQAISIYSYTGKGVSSWQSESALWDMAILEKE
mgnify:CR=1 FL=1